MNDARVDVLIVGAGPSGMTLACALATQRGSRAAWLLIRPDGHLAARGVTLETLETARLMPLAPTEALG